MPLLYSGRLTPNQRQAIEAIVLELVVDRGPICRRDVQWTLRRAATEGHTYAALDRLVLRGRIIAETRRDPVSRLMRTWYTAARPH
jgi:hypothetical protein